MSLKRLETEFFVLKCEKKFIEFGEFESPLITLHYSDNVFKKKTSITLQQLNAIEKMSFQLMWQS